MISPSELKTNLEQKLTIASDTLSTKIMPEITNLESNLLDIINLKTYVGSVLSSIQADFVNSLREVANSMLNVFGFSEYKLSVNFVEERNKIGLDLFIEKGGNRYELDGMLGGGLLDILSFALRVHVILATGKPRVLIMDEPFKCLSKAHKSSLAQLLTQLIENYSFQIIMVTHDLELVECLRDFQGTNVINVSDGALQS